MGRLVISYIGDLDSDASDIDILVDSDYKYIEACHAVDVALRDGADVTLWVRARNHFAWLQSFVGQL